MRARSSTAGAVSQPLVVPTEEGSATTAPTKARTLDPSASAVRLAQASGPNANSGVRSAATPALLSATSEASPAETAAAIRGNARRSAVRSLALLLRRPELDLDARAIELVRGDPRLLGLLLGDQILWTGAPTESPKAREDLELLARYVSITTGQWIHLLPDPAREGGFVLINSTAAKALPPEHRPAVRDARRDGFFGNDVYASSLSPELRAVIDAKDASVSAELSEAARWLADPALIPARTPTTQQIKQLGMIAYVTSDAELERLLQNLDRWEHSARSFGHGPLPLRLLDDSPEPFHGRIRAELSRRNSAGGPLRYETLGPKEKEQLRRGLLKDLLRGKAFRGLKAAGLTPERLDQALRDMFGGATRDGWSSGVAQNRNFSNLLLTGVRAFQVDHDMTPETLAASAGPLRKELRGEFGPTPFDEGLVLPTDILGFLEGAKDGAISSPTFSGGKDLAVSSMMAVSPLQPEQEQFHAWSVAVAQQDFFRAHESAWATLSSIRIGYPGMGSSCAPMMIPADVGIRFTVPTRDADLHLGETVSLHGGEPPQTRLPIAIFHRERAGSKWQGLSRLLEDAIVSEASIGAIKSIAQHSEQLSPRALGERIAEALRDPSFVSSALKTRADSYRHSLQSYLSNRRAMEATLAELLELLCSPAGTKEALVRWLGQAASFTRYGAEVTADSILSGVDPSVVAAELAAEIQVAKERIVAEQAEMISRFDLREPGLTLGDCAQLAGTLTEKLESYAIALQLSEEISAFAQRWNRASPGRQLSRLPE